MYPALLKLIPGLFGGLAVVITGLVLFSYYKENELQRSAFYEPPPSFSRTEEYYNCPVCLDVCQGSEGKKKIKFPCGHEVCKSCTRILFSNQQNKCPLCRKLIPQNFITQFRRSFM